MVKKRKKERAVSPIVSTILLVMIVVVLAAIIFLWTRSFIKEAVTKDIAGDIKTVDQLCVNGLGIKSFVNEDGSFGFTNNGNVPIYAFNVKETNEDGSSDIIRRDTPVNIGKSVTLDSSIDSSFVYNNHKEIKIIPILLGKMKNGNAQEYTCPEENGVIL